MAEKKNHIYHKMKSGTMRWDAYTDIGPAHLITVTITDKKHITEYAIALLQNI